MTQYSTDFSEYTTGVAPSDWTVRWSSSSSTWDVAEIAEAEGGKVLRHTLTLHQIRALSWNAIDSDPNKADVEILAKVRSLSTTDRSIQMYVRGGSSVDAYLITWPYLSRIEIQKYVVGGTTTLGGYEPVFNFSPSQYYWIRLRVNSTDIKAKIWRDGLDTEPASWHVEVTDSDLSTGWVGVGSRASDGGNSKHWDYVSIATNGETALGPDGGGGGEVVSYVIVNIIT